MNIAILKKLLEYIDARIEERLDEGTSSDEGLTTAVRAMELRAELETLVLSVEQDE